MAAVRLSDRRIATWSVSALCSIRILVADASPAVRGVVDEAASKDGDLAVVGEAHGTVELLVRAGDVDVVVLQAAGELPGQAEQLVDEYPRLGIVGIDADASHGLVYRLRPHAQRVSPITARSLIDAIRDAAPGDLFPVDPSARAHPHREGP
jgi:DNA-binding NarL/FixJ family response regulator